MPVIPDKSYGPKTHRSRRNLKRAKSMQANVVKQSKMTKIVDAQEGRCWFCGVRMGADCTKEHLLARARGGTDIRPEGNLKAAHMLCNSAAGHLPVADKYRLREVAHAEGVDAMFVLAKQLRRADARLAFAGTDKTLEQVRRQGPRFWERMGLRKKPSWWDV